MSASHQARSQRVKNRLLLSGVAGSTAVLSALLVVFGPSAGAMYDQSYNPTMTGSATVLTTNMTLLNVPIVSGLVVQSTGPVSTQSSQNVPWNPCLLAGWVPDVLLSGNLCAQVSTNRSTWTSTASSSVANLAVGFGPFPVVDLQGVASTATASCSSSPTGTTEIAYLAVGKTVVVPQPTNFAPNTVINVAGIQLIINQQTVTGNGITVNAVVVSDAGGGSSMNLVLSSSTAGVSNCGSLDDR
jgi:hypothetical protein